MAVEVYLIGPKGCVSANSFHVMTNSIDEARKAVAGFPQGEMKVIKVRESNR